ncbi:hypothetical protein BF93_12810 [Brachybacterium phenoliresistens]|uniref:Uncharacterized protein n=1 Tax=Brachybacterium phenoliresistens TaxID=396014 RepID=Z9JPA5_9MICO|nr:hypothetical protein BF93_12810 [Brachybacterium phenoliresistens]
MTRAATGSAQVQPSSEFSSSPISTAADSSEQISVCFASAIAEAEPSSRPVRRSIQDSIGMTARLTAARAMPAPECSGVDSPSRARSASAETITASPRNATAISRRAAFSRRLGSGAANCQATAAAERTSTMESRPKPISAAEPAAAPALSAITASRTL